MKRRASDRGPLCWLALRAGQFWDFVDKRDIDKHAVMVVVVLGTIRLTEWAMKFTDLHGTESGTDIGLKVAAVLAPWTLIASPAIKWYFDARPNG